MLLTGVTLPGHVMPGPCLANPPDDIPAGRNMGVIIHLPSYVFNTDRFS